MRHQLHQRRLTFCSQRLVGRQSEIRDQTSEIRHPTPRYQPSAISHQPSAISNQVIDLDRMSDDRCLFGLFASLPLAMHLSQLLLPALWAGELIAIAKCRAHCYFKKVVTSTPVLDRYQIRRSV